MASLRTGFSFFLFVAAILLVLHPGCCDNDDEKSLFQDLNNYRKTQGLPVLTRINQADCLADDIVEKLEKQACTNTNGANAPPSAQPQFKDYPNLLSKCRIDNKNTVNGTILPVCVRNLDPNMVITNYTRSNHAKFLNDSKYVSAGVGSEEDWMVVVLFANSTAGTVPTTPGGSTIPTTPGAAGGSAGATPSIIPPKTTANAASLVFQGRLGSVSYLFMGFVYSVIYLLN